MKIFVFLILAATNVLAYDDDTIHIGFTPTFIGMLDRVTSQDSGAPNPLGTLYMYPFHIATVHKAFGLFVRPSISYTIMPRKDTGSNVSETNTNLAVAVGDNMSKSTDWNFNLGIWQTEYKSTSGTYTDPGGGGPFHFPGNTHASRIFYLGAGVGWEWDDFRFGTDLNFFGLPSNDKRQLNMMLTFAWKGKWSKIF